MKRPEKISLNEDTIRNLYKKHKKILLPIGIIFLAVILFLRVVIPQIVNYIEVKEQVKKEQETLGILKNNLIVLSSLNDATLDSNLKLVGLALPIDKDFAGILTTILISSSKAGVSLGNFEFSVGELDSKVDSSASDGYPSLRMSLKAEGSLQDIKKFTEELRKSLPLSDIVSLALSPESSTVDLLFYYKALPPLNISSEQPVNNISPEGNTILRDIISWNNSLSSEGVSL
ncbi:hypothetical protein KKG52_00290, partial [Patescibacteria group bacterium]|nr:hypothetical protein [Patescibacteria group bacterium]